MTIIAKFNDPKNLSQLNDFVHDCWFEIEDIELDQSTRTASIRFLKEDLNETRIIKKCLFLRKGVVPVIEYLLVIHDVVDYSLHDTEGIGRYDFNKVTYDPHHQRLAIITAIPLDLEFTVSEFRITIKTSGRVVSETEKWSLFGF